LQDSVVLNGLASVKDQSVISNYLNESMKLDKSVALNKTINNHNNESVELE